MITPHEDIFMCCTGALSRQVELKAHHSLVRSASSGVPNQCQRASKRRRRDERGPDIKHYYSLQEGMLHVSQV